MKRWNVYFGSVWIGLVNAESELEALAKAARSHCSLLKLTVQPSRM